MSRLRLGCRYGAHVHAKRVLHELQQLRDQLAQALPVIACLTGNKGSTVNGCMPLQQARSRSHPRFTTQAPAFKHA